MKLPLLTNFLLTGYISFCRHTSLKMYHSIEFMQIICSEYESNNIEFDSIDELPTPENAQIWFCKDCFSTFHTQEKAVG